MRVLLVGPNSSRMSVDPGDFFAGARFNKTLMNWLEHLGITEYDTVPVCDEFTVPLTFKSLMNQTQHVTSYIGKYKPTHILALGSVAHKVLDELGINHYTLPLPKASNQNVKKDEVLLAKLKRCQKYLTGADTGMKLGSKLT